jgi:hypothetical protein
MISKPSPSGDGLSLRSAASRSKLVPQRFCDRRTQTCAYNWCRVAKRVREAWHRHRDRPRRGWDQRRPRHIAGDAHGVARAPGSGNGGRDVPSPGPGVAYGDRRGCRNHPYGSHIGILAVGKAGDLVLLDWDKLAYPYLDQETPVVEPVLQRAKSEGVDLVMVAGEVVYEGGRFIRVDRDAALRELHAYCRTRSPTTRSSGGSCRRRSSPMCGASTPAISIPTLTCPTIVRARGLTGECRSKLLRGSR